MEIYEGKIKATILDGEFKVLEQSELSMATKDGRYGLRKMANKAHRNGWKLLTEPQAA